MLETVTVRERLIEVLWGKGAQDCCSVKRQININIVEERCTR